MKGIGFLLSLIIIQAGLNSPISNSEQNDRWLKNLNRLSYEKKLSSLKERVLSDTIIFVSPNSDLWHRQITGSGKKPGECKMLIVINDNKKLYPVLSIQNDNQKAIHFCEILNKENFSSLAIHNPNEGVAFFGSKGLYGYISLTLRKGVLRQQLIGNL